MNKYLKIGIWCLIGTIRTSLLICKTIFDILNQLGLDIANEIEELKRKEEKRIFK